jgi:hypothetical protein
MSDVFLTPFAAAEGVPDGLAFLPAPFAGFLPGFVPEFLPGSLPSPSRPPPRRFGPATPINGPKLAKVIGRCRGAFVSSNVAS